MSITSKNGEPILFPDYLVPDDVIKSAEQSPPSNRVRFDLNSVFSSYRQFYIQRTCPVCKRTFYFKDKLHMQVEPITCCSPCSRFHGKIRTKYMYYHNKDDNLSFINFLNMMVEKKRRKERKIKNDKQ